MAMASSENLDLQILVGSREREKNWEKLSIHSRFYIGSHIAANGDSGAYDPLDPYGNINIRWDVMSWTPDGYVAVVTINNFQMYRHITGWTLGWTWTKKEVIWSMVGAQSTDQGDCSKFKGNVPHSCMKNPTIVDLLPRVPLNQQFTHCCKNGVLASQGQDPDSAVSSFQLSVGLSGTSNKTVALPNNFNLLGPGPGYTCSPATIVSPSIFFSSDGRRKTRAIMTWTLACTYSQLLAAEKPTCCVSLSSFYNSEITPCPSCACGCQTKKDCIMNPNEVKLKTPLESATVLQCTEHMCPIRVHWHVKANYKDYWRLKIVITNFNHQMNYTDWTLVAQHPNLNNVTEVYKFVYKPLVLHNPLNDTGMFYGIKFYNDLLMEAGPKGNVQTELILRKDMNVFKLERGWAFPLKVYFNGDECMMPPPDSYPFLPSSAPRDLIAFPTLATLFLFSSLALFPLYTI